MAKEIRLTQGRTTIVDDDVFDFLSQWRWQCQVRPAIAYAMRSVAIGKRFSKVCMHRLIMGAQPGQVVDHINHDGLDNRRSNLRLCSNSENRRNGRKPANKTSKYIGVIRHTNTDLWRAIIKKDGKVYDLGYFASEIEAARARDVKAKELHGEFASLNFPGEEERFSSTVIVGLCVNNENGLSEGFVRCLEIIARDSSDIVMRLEGNQLGSKGNPTCRLNHGGKCLRFGHIESMPISKYINYYGNVCWDACEVTVSQAARIINYLHWIGWTVDEAYTDLFIKYKDGRLFVAEDFIID